VLEKKDNHLQFNEDELHLLLQIINYWDSNHRSGTDVGAKIYKFFGYDVDFLNQRDKHWWVAKGDFKSLPFKSTNGSVCSDHKTLQEAIISAQESNEREGLIPQGIKLKK